MKSLNEDFAHSDRSEIKSIIRSELKSILDRELKKEVVRLMHDREVKQITNDLIIKALHNLYRFMWIRRSIWQNDIKV